MPIFFSGQYILAFQTTEDALHAEMRSRGIISCSIVPRPSAIGSGCGLCLRFRSADKEDILSFCQTTGIRGVLYRLSYIKKDDNYPCEVIAAFDGAV